MRTFSTGVSERLPCLSITVTRNSSSFCHMPATGRSWTSSSGIATSTGTIILPKPRRSGLPKRTPSGFAEGGFPNSSEPSTIIVTSVARDMST